MGEFRDTVKPLAANIESVMLDKSAGHKARRSPPCLLAGMCCWRMSPAWRKQCWRAHLAVQADVCYNRIQCTPDLLPSDITGVSVFNPKTQEFNFRPGPVFAQILVADEINRATPRTQAALLEAMAEGQVSIDGHTYKLEQPFIVFATQNPVEHEGTFPLPEAQLDRFMMRLSIGYPSRFAEAALLEKTRVTHPIDQLAKITDARMLIKMQASVKEIFVHEKVRDYLLRIVGRTRDSAHLTLGASPRASMMFFRAAQAYAAVTGRAYVLPDDIKLLARPVLEHRLIVNPESRLRRVTTEAVLTEILRETPAPTGNYSGRQEE
jgi:MoxR-like ATPase